MGSEWGMAGQGSSGMPERLAHAEDGRAYGVLDPFALFFPLGRPEGGLASQVTPPHTPFTLVSFPEQEPHAIQVNERR